MGMRSPHNTDMLAWFAEDERNVCDGCNEQASVTLPGARASFCLSCGAVTLDGVRLDVEGQIAV